MTRWGLLWGAAKPLLPWLMVAAAALLSAGFGAGFVVSDWRGDAALARAERACTEAKLDAVAAALAHRRKEEARLRDQARRDRQRAESLSVRMRNMAARAALTREELNDALAAADLGRCDAREPARLLREKAARYRRELARAGTDSG